MPNIKVRIMKNGQIFVETSGMKGKECVPYVQQVCEALDAVPLDLPESPQPVFDFSSGFVSQEHSESEMDTETEEGRLFLRL